MSAQIPDHNPDREWRWREDLLTTRLPADLVRKLLTSGIRRKPRPDGPSPSDRPASHTERPAAAAA